MTRVFLDANILVPSYTRTLLMMAAPLSDFTVVWSLHAESEAERHQEADAVPISALRRRFGWDVLVPDGAVELGDTDTKDKPILSAAALAGAHLVITENVRDFGSQDLARLQMSVVHPDLFLANHLSVQTYRDILERLARTRSKAPNTVDAIHRIETADRLPLLAERMKDAFPFNPGPRSKGTPRLIFRGVRCIACGRPLVDPIDLRLGLGPECATPD